MNPKMRLKMTCQGYPRSAPPDGDLEWDSHTGQLAGSSAARMREVIAEASAAGTAPAGPQGAYDFPITDPLHDPAQFAVLVELAGWILPRALEPFYPQFPDALDDDLELAAMSPADRSRVDF